MPPPRSDPGVEHAFLLSKAPTAEQPPQVQDSFHRHAVTWFLISGLLAIVGGFLFVYALPLVDKAYDIADEALELTTDSKVKITEFEQEKNQFLSTAFDKLDEVGAATLAVHGFLLNGTAAVDEVTAATHRATIFLDDGTRAVEGVSGVTRDATMFLHNGTQAIAAILVLAERLDATLTRVDAVLTSLEQTNAALQPPT